MERDCARARVGSGGNGRADDDHLWLQRQDLFQRAKLDTTGDRQVCRRQRSSQFCQLRERRTQKRLLIVSRMQTEQVAAQALQFKGARWRFSYLHHIYHQSLAMRPRAI